MTMDISKLTIEQVARLAEAFGGKESTTDGDCGKWQIGKEYLFQTVTHYVTGRLVNYDEHEFWVEDAAWIADTGRLADALKTGALNEVEPYPASSTVAIGRGALVVAIPWDHPLPREQK